MISVLTKWKVAVYLAAIFSAGIVSGWVVATRTLKHQEVKKAVEQAVAPADKEDISRWMRSSVHKLDLTAEQKPKVDAIIERTAAGMKGMHDEHMKRIRAAISNRNENLFSVLTAEQRQQYELLERNRRDGGRSNANSSRGRLEKNERSKSDREKREYGSNSPAGDGTNNCAVTNEAGNQSHSGKPSLR